MPSVLGEVPGESKIIPGSSIGYAPQVTIEGNFCITYFFLLIIFLNKEIALYNELSIYETLRFFSRLHGMNFDAFTKRKQYAFAYRKEN